MGAGIKFNTVDEYLATLQADTKAILEDIRAVMREAAPGGNDVISYNMPAIKLHKILVYYAAYKGHIGFYPTASGIETFKKELSDYQWSKGAIQFPINKPIPFDLISKIVKFRLAEVLDKAGTKAAKQKKARQ